MRVKEQIEIRLQEAFAPHLLVVEDVSYRHAGHAGAPEGGESHFELTISAEILNDKTRIAAHRLINQTLADLLAGPIHALQIKIVKS